LVNRGDNDVPNREKANRRWYNEKGNLTQAVVEAGPQDLRDFVGFANRPAHHWQFGGRYGHAEKADRQSIERLGVSKSRHGAGGQPTCQKRINVGADLYDPAADKDREEIADDGAHV